MDINSISWKEKCRYLEIQMREISTKIEKEKLQYQMDITNLQEKMSELIQENKKLGNSILEFKSQNQNQQQKSLIISKNKNAEKEKEIIEQKFLLLAFEFERICKISNQKNMEVENFKNKMYINEENFNENFQIQNNGLVF